jgi:hypothetical protein
MKKIMHILLVAGLTAGVFNIAEAQRGRSSGGSSGSSRGNVSSSRSFSGNSASSFSGNSGARSNSFATSQRAPMTPASARGINSRTYLQSNSFNSTARGRQNFSSSRIATSRPSVAYSSGYRNSYYRTGYNNSNYRGFGFMHGARYTFLPRNSISVYYGGFPYYYWGGLFYGYYGGFYQPIFPPIGIRVGFLPFGYTSFYLGGYPYYYYNGIYYRQYDDNNYEVVDPPMGASVYSLPEGAKSVIINGEKMYELNGTYYKEDRDAKGQTIYTVVGKYGQINNTDNNGLNTPGNSGAYPQDNNSGMTPPPAANPNIGTPNNNDYNPNIPPPSSNLQIGDVTNQLPQGSKLVTINGEQLYVTPDKMFLKDISEGGSAQYKVVGK